MSFENEYEEDDFESWEGDYYLIEAEDWEGLLRLRHARAQKNSNDCYDQWRYGEALVFNKQYEDAIEFLADLHYEYPDFTDVSITLLDALYALGKNEEDFDWEEKPDVLKLDDNALQNCISLLKNKRKPVSISDIYCDLRNHADYLAFKEKDLFLLLKNDKRFEITSPSNEEFFGMDTYAKLARK